MNEKDMMQLKKMGVDAAIYAQLMDRPIAYHPIFVDVTGSVTAAIFLSQAHYWALRVPEFDQVGNPRNHFFYKSIEEWYEETRLNYREQAAARRILRKLMILEETKRGIPARLYFKINFDALLTVCITATKRMSGFEESSVKRDTRGKFSKVSGKRKTGVSQNGKQGCCSADGRVPIVRECNTENTPEISTKIIAKNKPVAEGDGKDDHPSVGRLSFETEFGLVWSTRYQQLIDENRAVAMLKCEGVLDACQARRIIGEWSASMIRRPDGDPAKMLIWCCRHQKELVHTVAGDERLPQWA